MECPHYRNVLRKGLEPSDVIQQPGKAKKSIKPTHILLLVISLGCLSLGYLFPQQNPGNQEAVKETNLVSELLKIPGEDVHRIREQEERERAFVPAAHTPMHLNSTRVVIKGNNSSNSKATHNIDDKNVTHNNNADDYYKKGEEKNDTRNKRSHFIVIPGKKVDVADLAIPGKTTIFDFFSEYCAPCRKISPILEELDRRRNDIVVIKLNINRQGVKGIDWNSPLAKQYRITSIPYFIIYDGNGNRTHEGMRASYRVQQLLQE